MQYSEIFLPMFTNYSVQDTIFCILSSTNIVIGSVFKSVPPKLCVSEIMFLVKDIWILLAFHVHTQEALSLKINTMTLSQLLHNYASIYIAYLQIAIYWCIICYQYNLLWRASLCIIYVISTTKIYQVSINTPNYKILNILFLCSIYHNYLLSVSCDILPIKLFINNSIIIA